MFQVEGNFRIMTTRFCTEGENYFYGEHFVFIEGTEIWVPD